MVVQVRLPSAAAACSSPAAAPWRLGTSGSSFAGTNTTETINSAITLEGNYTFANNSTTASDVLDFGGNITDAATTTLTLSGANTGANTISGIISNGAAITSLTKSGAGTWILSAANTYTGLTTVSAGTLRIGVANAINTANSLTTSGTGVFDLNGFNQTLGNIGSNQSFAVLTNGGTITNSSSTEATLNIIDRTFASTNPSGAGAWTGNMNVILTADDTNQSGMQFTGNWSNTGNIILNDNYFTGTTTQITLATGTVNNTGSIGNSGLGFGTDTISANIGPHVTGVAENSILSPLTLSGTDTYTGNTSVNAGILQLQFTASNASGVTNSSPLVLSGGTLILKGFGSATDTESFSGTTINAGNAFVILTQNSATSLTASLGAITRNIGGTLNFTIAPSTSGIIATTTNGNDGSSGTITDSSGHTGMLGTWASTGTSPPSYVAVNSSGQIVPYTYTAGDTLTTPASITATNGTENYTLSGTTSTSAGSNAVINTLQYTGGGITITPNATGGLTVNGIMNAGTSTLTFSTNPITIGANKELVVTKNTGSINISSVIQDNSGGASAVTLNGVSTGNGAGLQGSITFSGVNTFTGPLSVNNGAVLLVTSNANLGGTAATVTLNGNGNYGTTSGTNQLAVNGGGFGVASSGAILTGLRSIAVGNGGGGDLVTSGTYDVNFTGSGGLFSGNHNEGTTVLLTGNNTFTGPSGIMNGKLMISSNRQSRHRHDIVYRRHGDPGYSGELVHQFWAAHRRVGQHHARHSESHQHVHVRPG